MAALSVESDERRHEDREAAARAARFGVGAKPAVRRTPPAIPTLRAPEPPRRVERAIEQRLDDDALEAGADVRDLGAAARRRRIGGARSCRRGRRCRSARAPAAARRSSGR